MRLFQKIFNRAKQSDGSYKLSSFWTAADTVEFNDGETLEECKTSMGDALDQKGDGLFYDEESKMLYLLSGENRLSGVEIIATGTGEILGDVSDVSIIPGDTSITLKWTDPADGQEVEWGGTTVIRKQEGRPIDCLDGTVVVESTTKNEYRTEGYVDNGLEKNTKYWYRFFPYSTEGQIRTGLAVSASTLKDETVIDEFPTISGTYTYNGNEQTVTLNNFDSNKMVISSGNTGTNAGEYQVCIALKTGFKWPDNSIDPIYLDWEICKALITVIPSQSGSVTYTGTARTPSWSNYDETKLAISGDTSGVSAGTYIAMFTPTSNYMWGDSTVTPRSVQWIIDKADISVVPTPSDVLNYTGSVLTPIWDNYDNEKLTISGQTSGTNVGNYIAVFTPTTNYKWIDGTTGGKEVQWKIVNNGIGDTPSQHGTLTYSGSTQSPQWDNFDTNKLSVTGDTGVNAGTYTATFTPKTGYTWSDGTTTGRNVAWTINRATINNIPSASGSLTYTGTSQSPTWNYYNSSMLTIGGTTNAINAGTYTATFTPKSNYQWSGGSTSAKSVSWIINKANGTLTLSKTNVSFSTLNETATSTASGYNGTLSATTSNSSVATVSISGGTVTITCKGNGFATITVTSAATTNYYAISKTISVAAGTEQKIAVPTQSGTLTYDGGSLTPTWNNYDSSKITIDGDINGTNAGTYTTTFTPKAGYKWNDGTTETKSVDWIINKAPYSFSVTPTSVTINVDETVDVKINNAHIRNHYYTRENLEGEIIGYCDILAYTARSSVSGVVLADMHGAQYDLNKNKVNPSSVDPNYVYETGINVIARTAGSCVITLTSSDPNYETATATINVTVVNNSPKITPSEINIARGGTASFRLSNFTVDGSSNPISMIFSSTNAAYSQYFTTNGSYNTGYTIRRPADYYSSTQATETLKATDNATGKYAILTINITD